MVSPSTISGCFGRLGTQSSRAILIRSLRKQWKRTFGSSLKSIGQDMTLAPEGIPMLSAITRNGFFRCSDTSVGTPPGCGLLLGGDLNRALSVSSTPWQDPARVAHRSLLPLLALLHPLRHVIFALNHEQFCIIVITVQAAPYVGAVLAGISVDFAISTSV